MNVTIAKQQNELDVFFKKLNFNHIESIINIINTNNTNKIIYFSGIGKNNTIIIHFIGILKSIGINTQYLSPMNCLHGDIGPIGPDDTIFLISKSGNTSELLNIVPCLLERTSNIYGIFCNEHSKLKQYCSEVFIVPCGIELDNDFNLIPSTSVACFILFCNIVIAELIKQNELTIDKYSLNHPAGNIGKRLNCLIKDIMISGDDLPIVDITTNLLSCLLMMTKTKLGLVLIINPNNELLGLITDGDIRRYLIEHNEIDIKDIYVNTIMNCNAKTFNIHGELNDLINEIEHNHCLLSGIPILDENKVVGLITHTEIL
jgi:arabinose-5-phosphate isomerase